MEYDVAEDVARANRIVEKLAQNPRISQIVADARLFDHLREDPAWQRLYSMVQADADKTMSKLSRRVLGPAKNWPTPDEVAYYRGFYQGAIFVLSHPEHAERNLEQAAKAAWAMYGDEVESEEA